MADHERTLTQQETLKEKLRKPEIRSAAVVVMEKDEIIDFGRESGGPIVVQSPFRPYQLQGEIYIGVASSSKDEVKHYHPEQMECYIPLLGIMKLSVKWWWEDSRNEYILNPGDLAVVPRGSCHYVEWVEEGVALCFKAPQITGASAKVVCAGCPNREACPYSEDR